VSLTAIANACFISLFATAISANLLDLLFANNRSYNSLQALLYFLALHAHTYNIARILLIPIFVILPLPFTLVPDSKVLGRDVMSFSFKNMDDSSDSNAYNLACNRHYLILQLNSNEQEKLSKSNYRCK
jgi:hypothetical protein